MGTLCRNVDIVRKNGAIVLMLVVIQHSCIILNVGCLRSSRVMSASFMSVKRRKSLVTKE